MPPGGRLNPVTVVIADDQDLIRAGLQAILATAPGIKVVAVAHDGGMAAALARHHRADVVLMDIQTARVDGLEGLARIAKEGLASKFLMLTMFDLDEDVCAALRAGASGFLLKTTPPDVLIQSILACHAGDVLFAPAHAAACRVVCGKGAGRGGSPCSPANPDASRTKCFHDAGQGAVKSRDRLRTSPW